MSVEKRTQTDNRDLAKEIGDRNRDFGAPDHCGTSVTENPSFKVASPKGNGSDAPRAERNLGMPIINQLHLPRTQDTGHSQ